MRRPSPGAGGILNPAWAAETASRPILPASAEPTSGTDRVHMLPTCAKPIPLAPHGLLRLFGDVINSPAVQSDLK